MTDKPKLSRRRRAFIWWYCYVEHAPGWRGKVGHWIYVGRRYLQGCRRVETDGYDAIAGSIDEPGLSISWGGACPVQGYGTVDNRACYYRSRGEGWQFHVAANGADPDDDDAIFGEDAWEYAEAPYIWPDGGWVSASVTERRIRKAVAKYRLEMLRRDG